MKSSILIRGLVFLVCGLVLYRAGQLARADAVAARCPACAARMQPASETYLARHAITRDQAGDTSAEVDAELLRAAAMNPRDSAVLRSLGVRAEARGKAADSERYLLAAVAVDHTFQPQWALANFYLRAGRMEQFWPAIRHTLTTIEPKSSDPRVVPPDPVFDLCWNVAPESPTILAQIPATKGLLLPYLRYLMRTGRADAAVEALPEILALPLSASDVPPLQEICDFLIASNRTGPAVAVWNHLVDRGLIHSTHLDPGRAQSVENPTFEFPLAGGGFGWKLAREEKVFVSPGDHFLAFELPGGAPEHFELLSKVLPVLPGRRYALTWRADGSRLELAGRANSGLRIEVSGRSCPDVLSTVDKCLFTTATAESQVHLRLLYDRPLGATRLEGVLRLESFGLEFQP